MTLAYKMLIADDEDRIRRILNLYLNKDGAAVDETGDGTQALQMALDRDYDILLLDWMMPGLNGPEICRMLKQVKATPVILLTAKADESDRLLGFEAGADDYVLKPFSPRELICRIHAILKRTAPGRLRLENKSRHDIVLPHLVIEHLARRVLIDGHEIALTLKEYDLLRYFALNENKTLTREELLKEVWKYEVIVDFRTVDSHIRRIREKMQAVSPPAASMLRTVWGIGYRLDVPASFALNKQKTVIER
ncbi:response regulator transcription factor [Paenibacillus elgii]|uniref:response regulator transcription factor n=1 Tax=Paenibacillus elgii TaxID=189691 RepID=UPI002040622A|nr:response regulator transcription factor [Paenibacillus elgii]MCM3271916.1 response regulator transcription factor [Paenibacillus elgii]